MQYQFYSVLLLLSIVYLHLLKNCIWTIRNELNNILCVCATFKNYIDGIRLKKMVYLNINKFYYQILTFPLFLELNMFIYFSTCFLLCMTYVILFYSSSYFFFCSILLYSFSNVRLIALLFLSGYPNDIYIVLRLLIFVVPNITFGIICIGSCFDNIARCVLA